MSKTLSEEWENAPANEKSLERHLKGDFPNMEFKVTWIPLNIRVTAPEDRPLTDREIEDIHSSAEYWHYCAFGTGIVWGDPIRDGQ